MKLQLFVDVLVHAEKYLHTIIRVSEFHSIDDCKVSFQKPILLL